MKNSVFCTTLCNVVVNQGKFKSFSKPFSKLEVLYNKILMYEKTVTTCLKYQVYLYGSEALTYFNAIL
jgi:hypothetical protein